MKAFKKFKSMTNQGEKFGGEAVKVLRKMPMWQRIVSAIVAFLLVFLLWPADAAKTITAWANDAETQVATEEGVTDPDPESPDPGGGGEESDDPEVDPETPEDPEVAGPVLEDSSNEEATEEDGQIIFEGPNDYEEEACGAYEWNFTGFMSGVKLNKTNSTPESVDYQASGKCAEIKFWQPYSKNNNVLDKDYAYINSSGFTTNGTDYNSNRYHKLKDDSGRTNTHGKIYSNFITITPNQDLLRLFINCASVKAEADSFEEFANIGIVEFKTLDNTYSKDFLCEVPLRSTNYSTIELTNTKGGVFKSGTTYAIYFRPNNCEYSDYANYGGVKINNIKAEAGNGKFKMQVKAPLDDTYEIIYMDSNGKLYTNTVDSEDGVVNFTSEDLPQGKLRRISIFSKNRTLLRFDIGSDKVPTIEIGEEKDIGTIDMPGYIKLKGNILQTYEEEPLLRPNVEYTININNDYQYKVTGGSETTDISALDIYIYKDCFMSITAKQKPVQTYNYKPYEVYFSLDNVSSFVSDNELDLGNCEVWGSTAQLQHIFKISSDNDKQTGITDKVKVMREITGWLPPNIFQKDAKGILIEVLPETEAAHENTYKLTIGDKISLNTIPSSLWLHDTVNPTVKVNSFTMADTNLDLILEMPSYVWEGEGLQQSCTATFTIVVSDELYTLKETVKAEDMRIDITKRPTRTETGRANLVAEFKDKASFTTQYQYDVVLPVEPEHIHEGGITFDKILTVDSSGKLPTQSGNYYLNGDLAVSDMATISKGTKINICLNGYALYWKKNNIFDALTGENASATKTFYNNQGTLNIIDCHNGVENCRHYFDVSSDGSWVWTSHETSTYVDGGIITGAEKSAIFNEGTLTCTNVIFVGNRNDYMSDSYGSGAGGGAIRSGTLSSTFSPELTLKSCDFKGNVSKGAGGSVLVGVSNCNGFCGTATFEDCYFSDNALIGTSYSTGYNNPWGGGALATFAKSKNTPTINIKGCEFYNNKSNYRGGAILLYHGTTCYMSDTIIQHNESGVYQDGSYKDFNYGGGINLYTGYGSNNPNQAFLYLSGYINCTENQSWTKESGVKVSYEDNLALQLQDNTKGYIYLEANKQLDPTSVIGVNYAKNTNIDISKGYGTCMLNLDAGKTSQDWTDPDVKCFVLDEVVGRLNYELLINTKKGNSAYSGSYELWIVAHQHNFTYNIYKSDTIHYDTEDDTLSILCGTGEVVIYVNGSNYTFSKCKYGHNSLPATIRSIDGGEAWSERQILYDGKGHGAEITNFYELKNHLFAQMEGDIRYFSVERHSGSRFAEENSSVAIKEIQGLPVEPGEYYAAARFYDVQINGGKVVVDKNNKYDIVSNHYYILGTQVTVEAQTTEKDYDGTNYVSIDNAGKFRIIDGLIDQDVNQVSLKLDDSIKLYFDPDNTYCGLHPITSWETNKLQLTGDQSSKYSIGNIVGYINVKPVQQQALNSTFQLTATSVEDTPSIDLYSVIQGNFYQKDGNIEFVDSTEEGLKYSEVGSLSDHTFTAKPKTQIADTRVQDWSSEIPSPSEGPVLAAKFQIYITKIKAVNLGPEGEEEIYEYLEARYDAPPPGEEKNTVCITGYIVYEGMTFINVDLKVTDGFTEKGHFEDSTGQKITNLSLYWNSGSYSLLFENLAEGEWGTFRFKDDYSTEYNPVFHNIKFVVDDPAYQLKKVTSNFEGAIADHWQDSYSSVYFNSDGVLTADMICTPIPNLTLSVDVKNPPVKAKVGDVIYFDVTITNKGNCDLYAINGVDSLSFWYESRYGILSDPITFDWPSIDHSLKPEESLKKENIEYTVDSSDVAYGSVCADVFSDAYYLSGSRFNDRTRIESNVENINLPVEEMVKKIEVEIEANPEKTPTCIGDKITYYITATNNSNVVVYSTKLSSALLGLDGYNAVDYGTLEVGQTGEKKGPYEYTVTASDVEQGYVINKVDCTGYVKRTVTVNENISGSGQVSTTIDYTEVDYPKAQGNLVYNGLSQQGVEFVNDADSDAMTWDQNLWQVDAGVYYCTFTLKPLYKWKTPEGQAEDRSTTHIVRFEIKKKDVSVSSFTPAEGSEFEYNEKTHELDLDPDSFAGFVDGEGIETATATTNGYAVGTYYKSTPNQTDSINISLTPNDNTNLANYNITYEPSSLTIKGYDLSHSEIVATAQDLTYNENSQTTRVTVIDTRFVREGVYRTLSADDFEITSGQTGTNVGDYEVTITGIGNYSGTKANIPWKINAANLKLRIVANSQSVEFDGSEKTLTGYSIVPVSNPQSLTYDGKIAPASTEVSVEGTNVGSYPLFKETTQFVYSDTNVNCEFVLENGYLTITPVDITNNPKIIITKGSLTYNCQNQDAPIHLSYDPDGEGGKDPIPLAATDYTLTGSTSEKNAKTYYVNVNAQGNYKGHINGVEWTINKYVKTITQDSQYERVYSGDIQRAEQTFNVKDWESMPSKSTETIVLKLTTTSSNVGKYQTDDLSLLYEFVPGDGTNLDNYALTLDNHVININKKDLHVKPISREFTYDGKEHHLLDSDVEFNGLILGHIIDIDNNAVTWSNNSATDATGDPGKEVGITSVKVTNANSQQVATRDVTSNYNVIIDNTAYLKINKAKMTIKIVGNSLGDEEDKQIYYDGNEKTILGYVPSLTNPGLEGLYSADKISPKPQECVAFGKDAGGTYKTQIWDPSIGGEGAYRDLIDSDFSYDNSNIDVTWDYTPGYLIIKPHVLNVTVNDSMYFDPDEAEHHNFVHNVNVDKQSASYELEGLADGENIDSITLETTSWEKGKYDTLVTQAGEKGFTSTIKWGEGITPSNYEVKYYVVLTIDDLQIITITGHRTNDSNALYYNGKEQSISGYEVSSSKPDFFHPENVKVKEECKYKLTVKGTNAGKYEMGLKPSDFYYDYGTDPYEIKVEDGYLEIKPMKLTDEMLIGADPKRMEYNGQRQGPNFIIRNGDEATGTYLTDRDYEITGGTAVDVGSYTAVISGQGNYEGQITPVYWDIYPADVIFTINGNTAVYDYDGQEHSVSGFTYSVDKLRPFISKDKLKIEKDSTGTGKDTAKGTNAGTYPMKIDWQSCSYNDPNINAIFKDHIVNGYVQILPKKLSELEITLDPNEFTYDGQEKVPTLSIYDKEIDPTTPLALNLFTISGTTVASAAGNYNINVAPVNDESNYSGSVDLPWIIHKAFVEIDITGNNKQFNYNGDEQSVTGFEASLTDPANDFPNFRKGDVMLKEGKQAKAAGTDAGKYYMGLLVSDFYYNDANVNAKFNIKQDGYLDILPIDINTADVTASPLSLVYNFAEQGPTVSAKYNLKDLVLGKDYYLAGSTATNVGDYNLIVYGVGNFNGSKEFDWEITKLPYHVKISGNQESKVYTGEIQSVSGYEVTPLTNPLISNNLHVNDVVTIYPLPSNLIASGKEVGQYNMGLYETEFSIEDNDNIDFSYEVVQDGMLTITGTPLSSCTISAVDRTYNGREQYTKVTVKDAKGVIYTEGVDFEITSGASATDAQQNITAHLVGLGNLSGEADVNWNMNKAKINAKVVGNKSTYSFDEAEHSASGYEVYSDSPLFNQGKVKCSQETIEVKGTNAGTYELVIQAGWFTYDEGEPFVSDPNVEVTFTAENGLLTIEKAEVVISCHSSATFVDESIKYSPDSSLIRISGTDKLVATLTTNSGQAKTYNEFNDTPGATDGFSSTLTWLGSAVETNYNVKYDVELIIKSSENKIVYIYGNTTTADYDETEKVAQNFTSVCPEGITQGEISLKTGKEAKAAGTNAGTYNMGLTSDDFQYTGTTFTNVEFVVYDGYVQINPRVLKPEMISVSPTQFTYNSAEQGPVVKVQYPNKESSQYLTLEDFDIVDGSKTDAGDYELQVVGKGNYTGTVGGFYWSIAKADLTLTVNASMEYSGKIFNYEIQESDMKGNYGRDGIGGTLITNSPDVGVYRPTDVNNKVSVNYTGEGLSNYNLINNVVLNITKRQLTVTPKTPEEPFVYNGLEQRLLDKDVEFNTLAEHHTVEIVSWANNGLKNVGVQNNVAVSEIKIFDAAKVDVTNCYSIDYETASLEVVPNTIKIKVEGNKQTFAYDGKAHSAQGYSSWEVPTEGATSVTGLFEESKLSCSKECKVTAVEHNENPYKMGITATDFSYNDGNVIVEGIEYDDGWVKITKNTFDAATISTRDFVYDGKLKTTEVVVSINGQVLTENVDYRIVSGCVLSATNVGIYEVEIEGLGRYVGSTKTGTWQITKANIIVAVSGNSSVEQYTGSEIAFPSDPYATDYMSTLCKMVETSATGLFNFNNVHLVDDYICQAKGTELGYYTLGLDVSKFVYVDPDNNVNAQFTLASDGGMQIVSRDISSFTVETTSIKYNGAEQSTSVTVKDADENELVYGTDYTIEGQTSAVNVGSYNVRVVGLNNYKGSKIKDWNITPASLTIKIIANEKTTEYNGFSQSVSGFSATAIDGDTNLFVASDILLMKGKEAILTKTDVNYDASHQVIDYVLELDSSDFNYDNPNIVATFVGSNEYSNDETIAVNRLKITPKTLTINAFDVKAVDEEKTPLEHRITTGDVDGTVAGQVLSGKIITKAGTAGEYTGDSGLELSELRIDGKPTDTNGDPRDNYVIVNNSILRITEDNQPTVYVTGATRTLEYNGSEQSIGDDAFVVTSNMPDFDYSKLTITGDFNLKRTNVGEDVSEVSATYADAGVTVEIVQSKLVIEKRSLTKVDLAYTQKTYQYNSEDQYPTSPDYVLKDFGTTLGSESYVAVEPQAGTSTNPGFYTLTLNAVDNGNYKDSVTVSYEIVKAVRTVTINGESDAVPYDGSSHSVNGYEVVETPVQDKYVIDVDAIAYSGSASATGTNAGTYTMGLDAYKFSYNGANKNYVDINYVINDGSLVISPIDISEFDVEVDETVFTYNAKAQGPKVISVTKDGVTVPVNSYDITGNSETNANTYSLTNYTLVVAGKGNYTGSAQVPWVINKANRTVNIIGSTASTEYTGIVQYVVGWNAVEQTSEGQDKVVNTSLITPDYASCVASGKDVGTYKMNLTNSMFAYADFNNVNVTFEVTDGQLEITQRDLNDVSFVAYPSQIVYNGTYQGPNLVLMNGDVPLYEDVDFSVSGDRNAVYVGDYSLTVNAKSKNYKGSRTFNWSIVPLTVDIYIKGNTGKFEYSGANQTVSGITFDTTLSEELKSLIKLNNIIYSKGQSALSVTGKDVGSYVTELSANDFSYNDANVAANFIIQNDITLTITPKNIAGLPAEGHRYYYRASEIEEDPTIMDGSYQLVAGKDYVLYDNAQTNVGNYELYVEGINNYFGQKYNIEWGIDKVNLTAKIIGNQLTCQWDGNVHTVMGYSLSVVESPDYIASNYDSFVNSLNISPGQSNYILSEVGEFSTEHVYKKDIDASDFTTIDTTNYSVDFDSVTQPVKLTITKGDSRDIKDAQVTYSREFEYDGSEHGNTIIVTYGTETLTSGTDYEIVGTTSATNVPEEGSLYSFTIVGKDNYFGQIGPLYWTITPKAVTYNEVLQKEYSGSQATGDITLDSAHGGLCNSESITLNLATKVKKDSGDEIGKNVGTYYYPAKEDDNNYCDYEFVQGEGTLLRNYDLSGVSASIKITQTPIDADVDVTVDELTYNGTTQYINPIVKFKGQTLTENIDYTLSGDLREKDVAVTSYVFTVAAVEGGNFTGSKTVSWNINKAQLTSVTISDSKEYDGSAFTLDDYQVSTGISTDRIMASWKSKGSNAGTYTLAGSSVEQTKDWSNVSEPDILKNYDLSNLVPDVTLEITKKPIDPQSGDFEIRIDSPTYNGSDQSPVVTVKDKVTGQDLTSADFEIVLIEGQQTHVPVGNVYHLNIKAKADSANYTGEVNNLEWTIKPVTLTAYEFTPEESDYVDDNPVSDEITLTSTDNLGIITGDSIKLKSTTNSGKVGQYKYDGTDRSTLGLDIEFIGTGLSTDYIYSFTATKNIVSPDMSDIYIEYVNELPYNGYDQRPTVSVYVKQGGTLIDPSEYDIVGSYYKNVKVDSTDPYYRFTVVDKPGGNYSFDNKERTWKITPITLTNPFTITAEKTYDKNEAGYSQTSNLSSADGLINNDKINVVWTAKEGDGPAINAGTYMVNDPSKKLTYEVVPGNSTTVLTNYVYSIDDDSTMTINKKALTYNQISGSKNNDFTPFTKTFVLNKNTLQGVCDGDEISATFTTFNNSSPSSTVGEYTYYVEQQTGNWLQCTSMSGVGVNNYEISFEGSMDILPRSIDADGIEFNLADDPTYTALANCNKTITSITDQDGEKTLQEGTDYEIVTAQSDFNKKDVRAEYESKYKIVVQGMGDYNGTHIIYWNIKPAPLNITYNPEPKGYDGKPFDQTVTLTSEHGLLEQDKLNARITTYKDTSKCGEVGTYSLKLSNDDENRFAFVKLSNLAGTNTSQNYKLNSLTGQVVIAPRSLDPTYITVEKKGSDKTYNGENQQPELIVKDTTISTTPVELVLGIDYVFASEPQKNVPETNYLASIKGMGNYSETTQITDIVWTIKKADFALDIDAEKPFDGEVFEVSGTEETGIGNEAFEYKYVTNSAELGTYVFDPDEEEEPEVVQETFEPVGGTLPSNYNIVKNVTLKIVEAPVPPQPEPDVPEYVPGQTGDSTPVAGFAIMALTLIGAFLFLRRPKKVQGLHIR